MGEIYDAANKRFQRADFRVEGNQITLMFSPSNIGGSTHFDFVILVRKYQNSLLVFDKAPDAGHYTFQAEASIVKTSTSAQSYQRLPNIPMEFEHATVYYNQDNFERARDIGEAFEYAYAFLRKDFGQAPARRFTVYVYKTQSDLVEGLIEFSGFSRGTAEFFRDGGAPRPINCIMHVSPQFKWKNVAHELTHTYIEEYSGSAYRNIKWLDEGLAEYEAYKCMSEDPKHRQEAQAQRESALNTVNKLKSENALYPLGDLSTEGQWVKEMSAGKSNYIYAEAFLVVAYMISSQGMEKTKLILREVQNGATASEAVRTILGITQEELLERFKTASVSEIFSTKTMTFSTSISTSTTAISIASPSQEKQSIFETSVMTTIILAAAVGVATAVVLHRKKRSSA